MNESLDLDDVTLVPEVISTIKSRDNVDTSFFLPLDLKINFKIPIIASPMRSVINSNIANKITDLGGLSILHRFCTIEEQVNEYKNCNSSDTFCAIGCNGDYIERFHELRKRGCKTYCIDVANGCHINVKEAIESILDLEDEIFFIIGNVGSGYCYDLCASLPNVVGVRCGIAGGCFIAGTKVITENGKKKIESIRVGEKVLTCTGKYQKVIGTANRLEKSRIYDINGIKCTGNHRFYVVNKSDKELINENNLENYAKWVSAEELCEDFLLIKMQG